MPEKEDADKKTQGDNAKIRQDLSGAYASLLAEQNTASFAAFTFEEAFDLQIERIEGAGTQIRPNALDRVSRIESLLLAAVEQAKAQEPDTFIQTDETDDVNTPNDASADTDQLANAIA